MRCNSAGGSTGSYQQAMINSVFQRCDLETMVSRLECTRVHFLKSKVSVSVSRPEVQSLGLGLGLHLET